LVANAFFRASISPAEAGGAFAELATRHYEQLFDGLRRQARERNVTLEIYVLVGHPEDRILKAAARSARCWS
jgi:hypothetical protein